MKVLTNSLKCIAILVIAYYVASFLLLRTGQENNSALVYVVAVVIISRITDGYWYGFGTSLISAFFINYFFMYPFGDFSLSVSGYPIAMASLLIASIIVSTLTTTMKTQAEQNARLSQIQTEIRIENEKEKMKANLLRGISHDLRTPLTGILGASSVILENQNDITRDEMVQFASNIRDDTQWLINMVENLLSVTRVSGESAKITKRDEIFEEIVTEAVYKVKKRFPNRKISVEIPDEILVVPMDSMLIQQVIINLTENAIRHSGDENPIKITLYSEESTAIFQIRDRGRGIGYENIDKLIENVVMNTEVSSDATRGFGLGLSVCKSIIKAHGGFLEEENAVDGGAIFRFGLKMNGGLNYEQ